MIKKSQLHPQSHVFWILILAILYLVGLIGMSFPDSRAILLPMTPFHLLLSLGVLLFFQNPRGRNFLSAILLIYVGSMLLEIAGVATGKIFGEYMYGDSLGIKFMNVPLMIGVNWVMLVISSATVVLKFSDNIWIRSILGASIMVGIDFCIEPLSAYLDFWYWEGNGIPLENYVAWWAGSFIFQVLFQFIYVNRSRELVSNPVASYLLVYQLAFFLGISLIRTLV